MEQLAEAARPEPQLFVSVKAPLEAIDGMFKNDDPVLVRVRILVLLVPTDWLPKFKPDGESPTDVPRPESLIVWGLPGSLV
jgi:hypothetical protein